MPTGRIYNFDPSERRGDLVWPRTKILNYPVQGLGADLMCIARVSFARRHRESGLRGLLISTIHDSIVVDCPEEETNQTAQMFLDVFRDIPANFQKLFGTEFTLPTRCEVQYGPTKGNMQEYIDSMVK